MAILHISKLVPAMHRDTAGKANTSVRGQTREKKSRKKQFRSTQKAVVKRDKRPEILPKGRTKLLKKTVFGDVVAGTHTHTHLSIEVESVVGIVVTLRGGHNLRRYVAHQVADRFTTALDNVGHGANLIRWQW